ncbi:MAG: VWA domain-containing protein [Acidobacteriota bacterium]
MKASLSVLLLLVASTFAPSSGSAVARFSGAAITPGSAAGESAPPQERTPQQFRAAVDMVLIDCVVLDDSGNFVHGLTRDDFRLSEEGDEVEITLFSEQHYGAPPAPPVAESTADAPASDTVVALPRYLVVFVDAFNTAPGEWDRLRPALVTYMRESLTTNDRVLVAILTPDGQLRVAPEFTSSAGVLESTLGYIQGNPEIRERTRQNERQLVS